MMSDRPTILWIEDDADQFMPVIRGLERAGVVVDRRRTLDDGAMALVDGKVKYDAIVCDNRVGGHGVPPIAISDTEDPGMQFLVQVRERIGSEVPAMLLTFFLPAPNKVSTQDLERLKIVLRDKHGISLHGIVGELREMVSGKEHA